MTAVEHYKVLVDRYEEIELSPTRFGQIERSTLFKKDPAQAVGLVEAPLAYPLGDMSGLELRVRPLLKLKLFRRKGRNGRYAYFYRFDYHLGADLVPDVE